MNFGQTIVFTIGLIWTVGVVCTIISMVVDKEPEIIKPPEFAEPILEEDNMVILSDRYGPSDE